MADQRYLNFIDMINGGGMGAAGSRFEGGGLLSMLGNALGIRPYGYEDRLSEMRPMARPAGLMPTQARPQLPVTGMDETLVAPQHGIPSEQWPFFKDPRVAAQAQAMPDINPIKYNAMLAQMRPEQYAAFRQLPPERQIELYNLMYRSF